MPARLRLQPIVEQPPTNGAPALCDVTKTSHTQCFALGVSQSGVVHYCVRLGFPRSARCCDLDWLCVYSVLLHQDAV